MDKSVYKWGGVIIIVVCFAYIIFYLTGNSDSGIGSVTGNVIAVGNGSGSAADSSGNSSLNLEDLIVDGLNFVVTGDEDMAQDDEEPAESAADGQGNESCRTDFTVKALRHNVKIYLNGTYGKIDVLVKDNTPGNVTCQNGDVVKSMRDCVPEGLVEFLNAPFKIADIVEFRCSSGEVTDNLEDCLPAYADAPPEEFFELKCRNSNVTISSLACRDECFAERVKWFVSGLDRKLAETIPVQS
ncbi:hypothetical protein KY363_06340 [Candidatus Woesearchaeota archaeon]|nr:hypothetical protein [Candidatus Woesearchaeota archaeon]